MTRKMRRRTFCASDDLWTRFTRMHGNRQAGRRLRELIEQDLERELPRTEGPGQNTRNSIEQTQKG